MRQSISLMLLLLTAVASGAQTSESKAPEQERHAEALKAFTQEAPSQAAERALQMYGVDAFPCDKEPTNERVHKSCVDARQAYYDYYAKGLARRTGVYEWNNFSTKVIFFVVLSLVAVGVYFSWKQFFGMTVKPQKNEVEGQLANKTEDGDRLVTELEMGLSGIKVKSPILGVILLTVSLAFFYLYLKYVYPVTNNF